jgi:hypothetical protein
MTTWSLRLVETFPAASLAQAYSVFVPVVAKEYETGAPAVHPASAAKGAVAVSVSLKPVTALLSEAVRLVIAIVSVGEDSMIEKAVITGWVISGKVITTWRLVLVETFPASSFAHAYSVFVPSVAKEYETGALADQPAALARGAVADSVSIKPVTALLSDAEKLLTGTTSEEEVAGMVNAEMMGLVISEYALVVYLKYAENLMFSLLYVPNVDGIPDDHVKPVTMLPGVLVDANLMYGGF